jgi:hypothetical protein
VVYCKIFHHTTDGAYTFFSAENPEKIREGTINSAYGNFLFIG